MGNTPTPLEGLTEIRTENRSNFDPMSVTDNYGDSALNYCTLRITVLS